MNSLFSSSGQYWSRDLLPTLESCLHFLMIGGRGEGPEDVGHTSGHVGERRLREKGRSKAKKERSTERQA